MLTQGGAWRARLLRGTKKCRNFNKKINNTMKNLGIILVIVGALLLVLSAVVPPMADLADQNWYTWGNVFLIIVGLITHIVINKRIY